MYAGNDSAWSQRPEKKKKKTQTTRQPKTTSNTSVSASNSERGESNKGTQIKNWS